MAGEPKKAKFADFRSFLWLPDEILEDLSAVLSHSPDAPDVRQVLSKVRKHLLGPTNLGPEKFIIFKDDASNCSNKNDPK